MPEHLKEIPPALPEGEELEGADESLLTHEEARGLLIAHHLGYFKGAPERRNAWMGIVPLWPLVQRLAKEGDVE